MNRLLILKVYLWFLAIFTLFWWPLSHWFYPDWYHTVMGFESYDSEMVKIIGTCGLFPVMLLVFSALNPIRNKGMVITVVAFSVCMAATYLYLIKFHGFPRQEEANASLLVVNVIVLGILYPWRAKE